MKNILLGMVSCLFLATSVHGLEKAIDRNDPAAVKAAIQAGADVNGKKDFPYLGMAAFDGKLEIVKILLDQPGVDVDLADRYGNTPLGRAMSGLSNLYGKNKEKQKIYYQIIDLLIKKGADLNAQPGEASSPISRIIRSFDIAKIREFLDKGAQVNPKSRNETPPIFAVVYDKKNWKEKLECLIQKGADITKTDKSGKTLLHKAASSNFELMKYLIEEKKVDTTTKDNDGHDVFYYACLTRDTSALEYVLNNKFVSAISIDTILALIEAVAEGNCYGIVLKFLGEYPDLLPPRDQVEQAIIKWNKGSEQTDYYWGVPIKSNCFSEEQVSWIINTLYPEQ